MSRCIRAFRYLLVIVAAAVGGAGCGESASGPDLGTANLIGVVYATQPPDMNPGVIWVRVVARSDPPTSPPDSVGVRIWEHTEIFFLASHRQSPAGSFSDIRVDDTVRVWHGDNVLLSQPPQVEGIRVEVF